MKIEALKDFGYKITIDSEALKKFRYILNSKYALEFTALHHCKREGNTFHIYDIFFPEQVNKAAYTEFDSEDIMALVKEGADITKLCGHSHSHVNFAVFASGTDDKEIKERALIGGFNASLIFNKKGDIFGHIADYTEGIYIQGVPVEIVYPFSKDDFDNFVLTSIKESEDIEEIRNLAKATITEYYNHYYPLEDSEIKELDSVIKNKFQITSTPMYPAYNKTYVPPTKGYSEKETNHVPVKKAAEIAKHISKSIPEMTDKEWKEFQESVEFGQLGFKY